MNPIETKNRIVYLDVLRGFALCGILLVNMPSFLGERFVADMGQADRMLRLLFDLFIQTKFYTLFSVLFGAGFIIFIDRLRQKERSLWVFVRRLTSLFVIGLVHLLFWEGDILQTYAICGFLLLLFAKTKPVTKLIIGLFLQLYTLMLYLSIYSFAIGSDRSIVEPDDRLANLVASHDIKGYFIYHATVQLPDALGNSFVIFPEILSLFLIGAYLMERFSMRPPTMRFLGVTLVVSLVLSLPALLQIVRVHEGQVPDGLVNYFFVWLSGRTLAVTYATAVALLVRTGRRFDGFQVLGRMALTNYLAQTLLFTILVFLSGTYGTIPLWQGTLAALVLLVCQMFFSRWYLDRHQQGPVEALWRKGTYGKQWAKM
ncbi:DUF418 domain-containing protein [Exiguobacterium sp. s193]|uniref:DUF418 domain-containing protein n=1 Tax=Exiguobacterium sp. s193 TaxID=2751207 RepID=UPI001BEA7141|nr:DUF418 domain-containing protein [Exiguobacterium sp. s193]